MRFFQTALVALALALCGLSTLTGAFSPSARPSSATRPVVASAASMNAHSKATRYEYNQFGFEHSCSNITPSTTSRFLSLHDDDFDIVDGSSGKHSFDLASTFATSSTANRGSSRAPKVALPLAAASWLAASTPAFADSPDWGIFEGRTGSILHPITMGGLFGLSLYTAFLGFQWRRQRTLGDDISALKRKMPKLGSYKTIQEALDSGEMEASQEASLKAALPVEKEIAELTAERKELASQGNRDKHYTQGAWIAFVGTAFAIEGPLNTFARAGKLFPGPHLYAGAGLVVCWAAAVACVPYMSKGNDLARSLHIASNVIGIALFAWQVSSGIPILLKVIEKTAWP